MAIDFSKYPEIAYRIVMMEEPDDDVDSNDNDLTETSGAECSICLESTDDPRRLPCGHVFCLQCLEGLWQTVVADSWQKNDPCRAGSREVIRCPNCRRNVEIPEGGPLNLPRHDEVFENESTEPPDPPVEIAGRMEECRLHVELYHASSNLELPMLNSMMDPLYKMNSTHNVRAPIQSNVTSSISTLDLEEKEAHEDTSNHDNYRHLPWSVEKLDKGFDVAFLPGSKMAVTDLETKSVTVYGPHGHRLHSSLDYDLELQTPHGLAYHPQRDAIIVCEFQPKTLCILSRDVHHIRRRIKLDSRPLGVAVMHNNHLVITSRFMYGSDSGRVLVMTYQGVILHSWHDGLSRPVSVTVDKNDVIYVCDSDNHRLVMYLQTGQRLRQFGNWSTMNSPRSVCSTPEGHILVAHNSRAVNTDKLSMWSPDGRKLGYLIEVHRDTTNQKIQGLDVYKNRLAIVYDKRLECKSLDRLPLLEEPKGKIARRKKWIVLFAILIVALVALLVIILVTTHKLHIE